MNTYSEDQYYQGYWMGRHLRTLVRGRNYAPNFWKGFVNGTIDWFLVEKELK